MPQRILNSLITMSNKEAHEISHKHTPIGVFWDIENVRVPRGKSASALVYALRNKFFNGRKEVEFLCVCDINKERKEVIEELNDAQVTVVHINATSKNAADDKIKQSLRRFADTFPPPANVVLISGDTNFATELSDLRHRHKLYVILVHLRHTQPALIACANESYVYEEMFRDIPDRGAIKNTNRNDSAELIVKNLPTSNQGSVKLRLKQLSDNCGGKVISVEKGSAVIRFPNTAAAARAKKRMTGEDVFGSPIVLTYFENGQSKQQEESQLSVVDHSSKSQDTFIASHSRSKSCDRENYCNSNSKFTPGNMRRGNHNQDQDDGDNGDSDPWRDHSNWNNPENNSSERSTPSPSTPKQRPRPYIPINSRFFRAVTPSSPVPSASASSPQFFYGTALPEHPTTPGPRFRVDSPNYTVGRPREGWQSAPAEYVASNAATYSSSSAHRKTPGANRPPLRFETMYNRTNNNFPRQRVDVPQHQQYYSIDDDLRSEKSEGSFHSSSTGSGEIALLAVTNLDYNISGKEWKSILSADFSQLIEVLNVNVQSQQDNTSIAFITTSCTSDARYAISQFHRKKIGYKRIHVTLVGAEDQEAEHHNRRLEIRNLLQEMNRPVPLFHFIEMYSAKYGKTISMSELFKMKDLMEIKDQESSGRMVLPITSFKSSSPQEEMIESLVCQIHGQLGLENTSDSVILPNVLLNMKSFSSHVHKLLQSHNENLPLISFQACYAAEFEEIKPVEEGVPLEHLISCVPGIKIMNRKSGIKQIQWTEQSARSSPTEHLRSNTSLLLSDKLHQFTKDVMELLKSSPQCIMPFGKFVPEYHHHFGRQCRVYDYGFSKLLELFEAIPHIVQIIGSGSKKHITLSHRAQVKRFTTDVLKMLRSQASKMIHITDFVIIYKNVVGKPFDIKDYGMCFIDDLLSEIPESCVCVEGTGMDLEVFIPRREQSAEEVERTRQFVYEVTDLLKHSPSCKMMFNKFIPAYHHHFGKQCKVSEYGFAKLVELFEAIPHAVDITENGEEKVLSLTESELLKVLEEQLISILKPKNPPVIPVPEFLSAFNSIYGYGINLSDFNVKSVMELMEKIPEAVTVEERSGKLFIVMVDKSGLHLLICHVLKLLMDKAEGQMTMSELQETCEINYGHTIKISEVKNELQKYLELTEENELENSIVQLKPLQLFARDARNLLRINHGKVGLNQFEEAYKHHFKTSLVPASYGYPSVLALLEAVPLVIAIRGKGFRRTVLVCKDFQEPLENSETPSPISNGNDTFSDSCLDQNSRYFQSENDSGIFQNGRYLHSENDSGIGPTTDYVDMLNQQQLKDPTGFLSNVLQLDNAAKFLPTSDRPPSSEDPAIIREMPNAPGSRPSFSDVPISELNPAAVAFPFGYGNPAGPFQLQSLALSAGSFAPIQQGLPNTDTNPELLQGYGPQAFGNPLSMGTQQANVPDSESTQSSIKVEPTLNDSHVESDQAQPIRICESLLESPQVGTPRRPKLAAKFNNPFSTHEK